MTIAPSAPFSPRGVAVLLVVLATAMGAGRILSVQRVYEPTMHRDPGDPGDRRSAWPTSTPRPMPTFSSNDRARWATVRTLVEDNTYVVGRRVKIDEPPGYRDSGLIFEDGWQTIDRVLRPETREFYSSKPPLLPTLVAGLYWILFMAGLTFEANPFTIVRTILIVVNLVPFAAYLLLLDRWAERFARSDWTRVIVVAAGAFATTVTPFLVTLNNHTLGAYCVLFSLDGLLRIWRGDTRRPGLAFAQAGFFAAFAVTNELPSLAFAAAAFGLLALCDVRRTFLFALPPALVVAAGFFGTNYLAVGQLRPAYSEFGSAWYTYEGSYWGNPDDKIRYGIDWARMHETPAEYALHVLVGHHGLFSLTPLWILAIVGAGLACRSGRPDVDQDPPKQLPRFLGPLTLGLTVVVVGFYLYKSDNYGGYSNGLRWLMWLSPLWLLSMIPAVDRLADSRWGRAIVYVLLAASVLSAHYSLVNPWRHPWIYDFLQSLGWHGYGR